MMGRPADGEKLSVHDANQLLHELEVYRVELEMQNQELQQAFLALEKSQEDYAELYDNAPVGYVTLDDAWKIEKTNLTMAALLGVPRDALLGEKLAHFVVPEDRDAFFKYTRQLGRSGSRTSYNLRMTKGDDACFYAELDSTGILREGSQKWRIVLRDATREVMQEKQLHQAQKLEAMGLLVGGVAHEFNNVLAIILGQMELAMLDIPRGGPGFHNISETLKAGLRAKEIVKQLLAFSRKQPGTRESVVVEPLIQATVKLIESTLPDDISVRFQSTCPGGTISCDPNQVQQVLVNLTNNAAHAMSDGGGVIDIHLEESERKDPLFLEQATLPAGSYLKITVTDAGCGIPPSLMERIFDPFFTTKEEVGTGLGLSVIHGIIQNHGGGVHVESEENKGSAFHVYFPTAAKLENPPGPSTAESAPPRHQGRVLVVEDNPSLIELESTQLEMFGYQVTALQDPVEAWTFFQADPQGVDILLTDLSMPRMSGMDLARQVQRLRPDLPVIICTGYGEKAFTDKERSPGKMTVLSKPLLGHELAEGVHDALASGESEDDAS